MKGADFLETRLTARPLTDKTTPGLVDGPATVSKVLGVLYLSFIVNCSSATSAHAYLDMGTGSYVL